VAVGVEAERIAEGVGDKHAAFAQNAAAPDLRGSKPVNDAVEADLGGQCALNQNQVFVRPSAAELRLSRDDADWRAAEPLNEVDVVRGEVLDDAYIADPVRERAHALGRDHEDIAEQPVANATAQLQQGGVEPLDVPDCAANASGMADPHELGCLRGGGRQRFLHENRDAGLASPRTAAK
jgi:hypothetical protein